MQRPKRLVWTGMLCLCISRQLLLPTCNAPCPPYPRALNARAHQASGWYIVAAAPQVNLLPKVTQTNPHQCFGLYVLHALARTAAAPRTPSPEGPEGDTHTARRSHPLHTPWGAYLLHGFRLPRAQHSHPPPPPSLLAPHRPTIGEHHEHAGHEGRAGGVSDDQRVRRAGGRGEGRRGATVSDTFGCSRRGGKGTWVLWWKAGEQETGAGRGGGGEGGGEAGRGLGGRGEGEE